MFLRLLVSCLLSSVQYPSRKINCLLAISLLSHFPFPSLLLVSFYLIKHKTGTCMIKQWKVRQRVTPCAWTLPYFIISLFSAYLFCSFFLLFSFFHNSSCLVVLISKRKREGRDKGGRKDKEECHLLSALFCLLPLLYSSLFYSFLCYSIEIGFLLSLLSHSLSLLFSCSSLNDKNTRKEEQEGNGSPFPVFSCCNKKEKSIGDKEGN